MTGSRFAFTLVELLVVMAVIIVMLSLLGPAVNALKGASDVTKAAYDIAGILEEARAHAIANHTYVWVGIGEFDASKSSSDSPQTPGVGRVVIAVVASKDGTRGYNVLNNNLPTPPWQTSSGTTDTGATLLPVSAIQSFDNMHLATSATDIPNTGRLTRRAVTSGSYQLGNTATSPNPSKCVTQFAWPIGQSLASSSAKYKFQRVINFDPTGSARIQYASNTEALTSLMEIGLLPTHGNVVNSKATNVAAIQVNGFTGRASVYRP